VLIKSVYKLIAEAVYSILYLLILQLLDYFVFVRVVCIVCCKLVETFGWVDGSLLEGTDGWHGKMHILYDKDRK
jgi:hypothetical protein